VKGFFSRHGAIGTANANSIPRMNAVQPLNVPMNMSRETVKFTSLGDELCGTLFTPGSGGPWPTLIVCHGAGEFKENYIEMCEYLGANGIASLALDLHGHGGSKGERFVVRMKEWVADVRAALDFLASHPKTRGGAVGAFGLSSGGTAILEAAMVDDRLKALVALDATVRNSLPFGLAVFLGALVWIGAAKKSLTGKDMRVPLAKLSKANLASDPEVQTRLLSDPRSIEAFLHFPFPSSREAFFIDTIKNVGSIKAPTMILWGEDDKLDPPETGRLLLAALTCEKQLHIIPGNGHVGHLDRNRQKVFELTAEWALKNLAPAK
jgi:pimeloyl-ACP methyl ester carboxylesterase